MDLKKIFGAILIVLGILFRAISIAYYNLRLKAMPDDPKAQSRLLAKQKRALLVDYAFILIGIWTIIMP